ncbi:MAG: hypothetical protein ACYTFG_11970 [Planctomycetota bacterium]
MLGIGATSLYRKLGAKGNGEDRDD